MTVRAELLIKKKSNMSDKKHKHSFKKTNEMYLTLSGCYIILECTCGKIKERKATPEEEQNYLNENFCKDCGIALYEHQNEKSCFKVMHAYIKSLENRINDLEYDLKFISNKFNF